MNNDPLVSVLGALLRRKENDYAQHRELTSAELSQLGSDCRV